MCGFIGAWRARAGKIALDFVDTILYNINMEEKMDTLTYTLIQVTSTWSPNLMDWEEDDRLYVGEVELPVRRPVESESFAKLLEPEDIPLLIYTELNAYGHRTIEMGTHDGQKMYEMVSQKPEPEGEMGEEDGYGGLK